MGRELSTKGRLLVATPPLGDPNFDRSVVYMLEHNDDGAVGVVLNRPLPETVIDGLEDWFELVTPPAVVYAGGPVEVEALIGIARVESPREEAWSQIAGQLGSVDLAMDPTDVADRFAQLRIFQGYSGWGEYQLDSELSLGVWIVVDAEIDDVFSGQPDELWRTVLRRQGGRLAWIANAPDDLSMN